MDGSECDYDEDPVWVDRTGPHFRADIEGMIHEHGTPCGYVSVPFIYVDYRALERDQLDYYLYWRDRFWEGEMLRTCEGYLWLLANEIGLSDRDPVETYDLLMKLWGERRFDLFDPSLFTEFVRDYAIEHNLPRPPADVFGSDKNEALVNSIACCPEWYIDIASLSEMTNGFGIKRDEADTVCRIVEISLRRLIRMSKGQFDSYSSVNLENVHDLYRSYPLLRGRKVAVDSPDLFHNRSFRAFIRDVTRYASSLLRGLKEQDRPQELSDLMTEIITDVYEHPDDSGPECDPKAAVTVVKEVAERYIARGLHPSLSTDEKDIDKVSLMAERNIRIPPSSAQKLLNNWNLDSDEPCRYVKSGFVNPSYDTFTREQYDYYIFWRTQFRKGRYLETDDGYIRLFVAELVSCSDDPKDALETLVRLRDTYRCHSLDRYISVAMMEYSVIFGIPVNDTEYAYESLLNGIACMCMERNPMMDMTPDVLASISGIDKDTILKLGKEGIAAINESLRRIDSERIALGIPPTLELFNVQIIPHSAFYTMKRDFPMPSYNSTFRTFVVKRSSSLRSYISNTIKLVATYISKFSGKKVTIKIPKYHGERSVKIVEESVMKAFGLDPKRKKKLELDPSALKSAQDDLSAVTEMMSTEEEEKEETPVEEVSEEGWGALVAKLDDDQMEYLADALGDGSRCSSIARRSGKTVSKMEDSINSIAMDMIGDTIVENQSVIDDYRGEVISILPPELSEKL